MTASYFVFYHGNDDNLEAFVKRYCTEHVKFLRRFPGIRRIRIHTPHACHDPYQTTAGEFRLIAEMEFDSPAALEAALHSTARAEAREDYRAFPPPASITVWHQAMDTQTAAP